LLTIHVLSIWFENTIPHFWTIGAVSNRVIGCFTISYFELIVCRSDRVDCLLSIYIYRFFVCQPRLAPFTQVYIAVNRMWYSNPRLEILYSCIATGYFGFQSMPNLSKYTISDKFLTSLYFYILVPDPYCYESFDSDMCSHVFQTSYC
jgi:hypothetical protein